MSDARTDTLQRLRAALADRPEPPEVQRTYDHQRAPGSDVVTLFTERVADYRATVLRADATNMVAAATAMLNRAGVRRLAKPAGTRLEWLSRTGVELVPDEPRLSYEKLDALDGVVTGCAVAIAETGTVILDGGPDQGRRVLSLLPDYHLCIVRADQIVDTVPEAVRKLGPSRPQTWISGPSATSDIEMNRIEGVHGPRTLHVLVLG